MLPGFSRAAGNTGFARSVSPCRQPSPGIAAGPSNATTSAPPSGSPRCNSAGPPGGDESVARTLWAGNTAAAADARIASVAHPLAFCADL